MTTNEKTQPASKRRSIRESLRSAWQDSHRAHQALFQAPYDDYLRNHRAEY